MIIKNYNTCNIKWLFSLSSIFSVDKFSSFILDLKEEFLFVSFSNLIIINLL